MTVNRFGRTQMCAVALLVAATFFAFYRWHYSPQLSAAAGLQTLSDVLRIEANTKTMPKLRTGGTAGGTIPELLAKIQEIATQRNVAVRSVTPVQSDAQKMSLSIHGDFRDLMVFFGRLETFQVTINAFDFAPDEGGISGSVEIVHSAKPGAPTSFADYLDAVISYSAIRNPFEIGNPVPTLNAGSDLGDLSWTYHLTSILLYGAERVATIDGQDYRIGDQFGTMHIKEIGPSSVSLSAPNQPLNLKLHFRQNPQEGTNAG